MSLQFERQAKPTALKYGHILSAFHRAVWAILPEKLAVIQSFLQLKASGGSVSAEQLALVKRRMGAPYLVELEAPEPRSEGTSPDIESNVPSFAAGAEARTKDGKTIAVLPLTGTISHRMGMLSEYSGGISTERFTQWLRAAADDPSVKAIVIDADSPGGTVDGVPELGDEIARVNKTKPVIGVANAMAASAAYWLLSQCGELVVTPSGMVGSVGIFASHEDVSKMYDQMGVKVNLISAGKFKTEGNPYEPLSDDARNALQGQVNDYYNLFTAAVARGRGTDQKTVKSGFGEGRVVLAQQAVKEGMADRVATLDQTLAKLGAKNSSSKVRAFAAAAVMADDEMDEQNSPLPDEDEDRNPEEQNQCKCKCEACRATPPNCAECSNEVCADSNCAHEPRADTTKPSVTVDWKSRLAARRRALNFAVENLL